MRYPTRFPAPPLGAQGQDVRSQQQVARGRAVGTLESANLAAVAAGLILADWSARSVPVGAVASWVDEIAALTLVQADATKQPVKSLTGLSENYEGVVFDGVNDFLRVSSVTGLPVGAVPGCIFMVASRAAMSDPSLVDTTAVSYGGTSAGTVRMLGKTVNVPRAGDGTDQAFDHSKSVWEDVGLLVGIFNADGYVLRFNGEEIDTVASTLNTSPTSITVGADNASSPSEFHPGAIARLQITSELTQAQIEEREGWLAAEYGIQSKLVEGHPYALAVLE